MTETTHPSRLANQWLRGVRMSKFDGDRWNDLHYRNAARQSARAGAREEPVRG